jgi:hypothetical protein
MSEALILESVLAVSRNSQHERGIIKGAVHLNP